MQTPNLFDFATSELSQDAFICWLASWANPMLKGENPALHATATDFLDRLLEAGRGPKVSEYRSIEVHRQSNNIDVFLVLNGDTAIIIEDKTVTKDHSGQLKRYKEAVAGKFPDRVAAVYLKTGDQGNYRNVAGDGYGCFLRRDFIDILNQGEQAGERNDIFVDFLRHLRKIEAAVQSFSTAPLSEWDDDRNRWSGLFLVLQGRLDESDWNYVANPRGGFMAFWWHGRRDKYLQLENEKLCFKIGVQDKAERTAKWWEWHNALIAESGAWGIKINKPIRREGKCMTVAVLDGDYRQSDTAGQLDLERTMDVLKKAEGLMDAALLRIPGQTPAVNGANAPESG